jgi:F-type H+-transporting ATPase subunit b
MLMEPEFWVGVGFVLVIGLLVWKGIPGMVGKMLDQRSAVIAAELSEAKRLHDEAVALLADYKKKSASAESRASLKTQIERRAQAAQDKIAQAEAAAMNEIRALAANAAAGAAEKLIAARMDENRAATLIEGSIKDLGSKLN